jgi:hypothetical protein
MGREDMKIKSASLFALCSLLFALCNGAAHSAAVPCSKLNLVRCLDSACAINSGANPAARCQLCGTATAGAPADNSGMTSVSLGISAKISFSAKELKNAPADPGARYAWAAGECIKKVTNCTVDDVSENYDKLIEQSCRAAGVSASMSNLLAAAKQTKSESSCRTDITACIVNDKHCGANYALCTDDADLSRNFAACATENNGCDEFAAGIRTTLISARDTAVANRDTLLANIVAAYQTARETKLKTATDSCKNNAAMNECITAVCNTNMKNKCAAGDSAEKSMATLLCKYHETACNRLK